MPHEDDAFGTSDLTLFTIEHPVTVGVGVADSEGSTHRSTMFARAKPPRRRTSLSVMLLCAGEIFRRPHHLTPTQVGAGDAPFYAPFIQLYHAAAAQLLSR